MISDIEKGICSRLLSLKIFLDGVYIDKDQNTQFI